MLGDEYFLFISETDLNSALCEMMTDLLVEIDTGLSTEILSGSCDLF